MKFLALLSALVFSFHLFAQENPAHPSSITAHTLLPEQLYYDVTFYDLEVTPDLNTNTVVGVVRIEGRITHEGTAEIVLNLYNSMMVDSIQALGQRATFEHSNNVLSVALPRTLRQGELFSTTIHYHGNPRQGAPSGYGLIFTSQSNRRLIFSYNWPYYANTWFPCKDHPSDKADSARLVITVPDIYQVAANGVLIATNSLPKNRKQFVWKTLYPISPYHMSIHVHPFEVVESSYNSAVSGNVPLRYHLFPNTASSARAQLEKVVPQIHSAFEARYGAFPFSNEKYGVVESIILGGMEHQTILTMYYQAFFNTILPHESAHEYFGNMISISDWPHIWLSEGFATYSEAIFREHVEGAAAYRAEIRSHMNGAGSGAIYISDTSTPDNIIPYNLVYLKASTVLHMLRYVMGDRLFFKCLHDYVTISEFRYKNIDTEQFRQFCERYYGRDLKWFFDQWIYGDGKMSAEYYHFWNTGADSLIFKIRSVPAPFTHTTHAMPMPISFGTTSGELHDTVWIDSIGVTKAFHFSDSSQLSLQFDPDNQVLNGPFTFLDHPVLEAAYLRDNAIYVSWKPFFDFADYEDHVWREDPSGDFIFVGSTPVRGLNHSFTPDQGGTYRVGVVAMQNGRRTKMSDFLEVDYTTFPMDRGMLIIDETRNGDGANMLQPKDETVDAFYEALLAGYSAEQFDVVDSSRGPNVFDLASYSVILWHHEVTYPTAIQQSQSALQAYLDAGGQVILSGMDFLNSLGPSFTSTYLGFERATLNSTPDFLGASGSRGFPNLEVDTAKIDLPFLNERLLRTMVFDTAERSQTIFRYVSASANPLFHQKPCGLLASSLNDTSQIRAITLGFPLHFMKLDSSRAFIEQALRIFGVTVGVKSRESQTQPAFNLSPCHPNPFNASTLIRYALPRATQVDLKIYNVVGQEVRTLVDEKQTAGKRMVQWDGRDQLGRLLSSGIYFYRMRTEGYAESRKMLLVK